MGKGGSVVAATVAAVALVGCPNDGEPDSASDEFCEVYLEALELGLGTDEGMAAYRRVAELAPADARAGAENLVALAERAVAVSEASDDVDLTGDMEYMELVLESRTERVSRSLARLIAIGREDCGAPGLEQTELTPFTSVGPLED